MTVLSLATKQIWKNRETGERESQTTWHRCVVFGRTAEYAPTLTKGTHLQIIGEIQTRDFVTRDGAKKSVTDIRVHRIARLNRVPKAESTEGRRVGGLPTGLKHLAMMQSADDRVRGVTRSSHARQKR